MQAVIPWGGGDEESQQAAGKLRVALDAAFKNKLGRDTASTSGLAAHGVPASMNSTTLGQLIGAASKRYLGKAAAFPRRGEVVERPRISGRIRRPGGLPDSQESAFGTISSAPKWARSGGVSTCAGDALAEPLRMSHR